MSIILKNLSKTYGESAVVNNVSLEIQDGELFVLLGASGSGKSTILRMIAGLIPVEDGTVMLHGRDVTHLSPQERNTGFVFQNYSLFRHMTVAENVEFGLAVRKRPPAERAAKRDELLALVGLAGFAGRLPRQLSGGQQQRVAVARALAFEPSVLLLDEPFGALDVKIRGQLRRALRDIQRSLKVTTILVTHDQEEAFELADRIGVVEQGRLLEVGPPAELYRRPRHEFVATFVGEANLLGARSDGAHVRLGDLSLPLPVRLADQDPGIRWAALFRPEDLSVARERDHLGEDPVLGQGLVEEVLDLGAVRRVRVRLDPLQGVWPLGRDYGEGGITLLAALPWKPGTEGEFRARDAVWVGVRGHHLLPRVARRFLIVVDGASSADEALDQGFRLARSMAAAVTVLCVAQSQNEAERLVAELRERLAGRTPAPSFKLRLGDVIEEVAGETTREHYDLVVVPGRSEDLRARLSERIEREVVPGLTSERIAGLSPFPVLVAHGPRPEFRRILLCTAAGEPGKLDVFFGGQVARTTGAAATLLFVDGPAFGAHPWSGNGPVPDGWRKRFWIERHLEQGLQTLSSQGVEAHVSVRQGDALEQILAEADEQEHDLIVIGGHLVQTWADAPERDLATELVARSSKPVLVVKGQFNR
jgi:ABC-type Fe3+/spermidine/putrescine transport system ATPase subunit/nucleotide-binding universal stress UspA family protein